MEEEGGTFPSFIVSSLTGVVYDRDIKKFPLVKGHKPGVYYVCAQLYLFPLIISIYYCVHSLSVSLPVASHSEVQQATVVFTLPFLETTECTLVSVHGSV